VEAPSFTIRIAWTKPCDIVRSADRASVTVAAVSTVKRAPERTVLMPEIKSDEQVAKIEELLDECNAHLDVLNEFQWRMTRAKQIQSEVAVRMQDFMMSVKEVGQTSGLESAEELLKKIRRMDERIRQLGNSPGEF
jgi:hypothetical protein